MNDKVDEFTEAELIAVTKLVDAQGDQKAAKTLGVSVGSLLRVLARRGMQRGTVVLIQQSLQKLGLVQKVGG